MEVTIRYCGGWGYGRFAQGLANLLDDEFPGKLKFKMDRDPGTSGAFEVTVDGELVHSKLTKSQGRAESAKEQEAIKAAIGAKLK